MRIYSKACKVLSMAFSSAMMKKRIYVHFNDFFLCIQSPKGAQQIENFVVAGKKINGNAKG